MTERRSVSSATPADADAPRAVLAGILATGLAAALGAVLTSYVGVQGTVAGAMVGAMIVSGLSQVVRRPLDRLERWLLRHGLLVVRRQRQLPAARVQAVRLAVHGPASETPRIGWRVLVIGGLGFVVGMAAISGFELSQGKPLSATTAHQARTGTTVGNLVRASVAEAEPPTAESTAEPAATSPSRLAGDVVSPGPRGTPGVTSTPARSAPATPTAGPPTPGARPQPPAAGPVMPTLRPSPLPSTTASR